jgi:protein xylosyltransferase
MKYLRYELKKLEELFPDNVKISDTSFATIWGGAQLLDMHLEALKQLLQLSNLWKWDFILNLSETEFPIKYENYFNQNYYIFDDNDRVGISMS